MWPLPPDCPCSATFDPDTIRSRLRELAFLNSRATIFFRVVDGKKVRYLKKTGEVLPERLPEKKAE